MKKYIAEELPTRENPQASQSSPSVDQKSKSGGAPKPEDQSGRTVDSDVDKKVRQAIYDIRYRARREGVSLEQAYSQYIQNSNLPQEAKMRIRESLFPKGGGSENEKVEESYTSLGMDLATTTLSKAMFKVFVEGVREEIDEEELKEAFTKGEGQGKKYKVKVTDESGVSYVRWATREKVSQLRANPKITSVEMTDYGSPYEGEGEKKKKGKLDPVGKEDGDVDNDGKKNTKSDKYLLNRRAAIGKAMANEEFIGEVVTDQEDPTAPEPPVDIMLGKNRIKVANSNQKNPHGMPVFESSMEKFMKMARIRLSGTCPKCEKSPCECDNRDKESEMRLLKNKVRAMGVKNPIIMNPPEGEDVMKVMTSQTAKMTSEARVLAQQGGVPGTVEVKKSKEGGFLGMGAKTVTKPVPGSFTPKDVSSQDAARYNQAIDNRFKGHSGPADQTPATAIQRASQRKGHSGYMKVKDPSSIPNTGIPNRPTPARSSDQNDAMSWQVGNKFKK